MKRLLKMLWRCMPASVRENATRFLCSFLLDRADQTAPPETGPYFVVGNYRAVSGLARGARLYAAEARARGMDIVCVDVTREMLQAPFFALEEVGAVSLAEARKRTGPGTVIFHLNPPQFQLALLRIGKDFLRGKRIQGYWAWELEDIPPIWRHGLGYVHEVFVPSRFVQDAIVRHTQKPVVVLPHPVKAPPCVKKATMTDGVLRCLFIFDAASLVSRKNPAAVIEAFRRAFIPGEAVLTLKVGQPEADRGAVAKLEAAAAAVAGIRIITAPLSEKGLNELYLSHTVYVSLHRSEGYGLTIREAMVRGLYIVATGWSGNVEFMQGNKCFPVPYRLVPVESAGFGLTNMRCQWAEPDIDAAASILRSIRERLRADA